MLDSMQNIMSRLLCLLDRCREILCRGSLAELLQSASIPNGEATDRAFDPLIIDLNGDGCVQKKGP